MVSSTQPSRTVCAASSAREPARGGGERKRRRAEAGAGEVAREGEGGTGVAHLVAGGAGGGGDQLGGGTEGAELYRRAVEARDGGVLVHADARPDVRQPGAAQAVQAGAVGRPESRVEPAVPVGRYRDAGDTRDEERPAVRAAAANRRGAGAGDRVAALPVDLDARRLDASDLAHAGGGRPGGWRTWACSQPIARALRGLHHGDEDGQVQKRAPLPQLQQPDALTGKARE